MFSEERRYTSGDFRMKNILIVVLLGWAAGAIADIKRFAIT